jgi:hypothetical protein
MSDCFDHDADYWHSVELASMGVFEGWNSEVPYQYTSGFKLWADKIDATQALNDANQRKFELEWIKNHVRKQY